MANIITWINKKTGVLTKRLTIRVEHRLDLHSMSTALVQGWLSTDSFESFPETMSAKAILEMVREAYEVYGTNAVWTWADEYGYDEVQAMQERASLVILAAFPDFKA
jgi:hypothetical protein